MDTPIYDQLVRERGISPAKRIAIGPEGVTIDTDYGPLFFPSEGSVALEDLISGAFSIPLGPSASAPARCTHSPHDNEEASDG